MSTADHAHSRNPHAYDRKTCATCGAELPRYAGRGRPSRYCDAEATGRPCVQIPKAIASLRALLDKGAATVPANKRETYLRGLRGTLRQLSQDLTLTVAVADGDTQRAAAVGKEDPIGFGGD